MDAQPAETLRVSGGRTLRGRVAVHAGKNAVLPLMASCLLTGETVRIRNVPKLLDVCSMGDLLQALGVDVRSHADGSWLFRAGGGLQFSAPPVLVAQLRASTLMLGPLLSRLGRVRLHLSGGCAIGTRPINLHLAGLAAMGARVCSAPDHVDLTAPHGLHGASLRLDYPSVGATENLLLAACLASGRTEIANAAAEPEIADLADCLNSMGAAVRGGGTTLLRVDGRSELGGADHTPIADRIEAGTLLIAGAMTGGDVAVDGAVPAHLGALIQHLRRVGAEVWAAGGALRVRGPRRPRAADVRTAPHPGFSTDLQPMFCALLAVAAGTSVVTETVFDDRLGFIATLRDMGADVRVEGRRAFIRGVGGLRASRSAVADLRSGAAMVLAALVADGESEFTQIRHIDRGYVDLAASLRSIGADLQRGAAGGSTLAQKEQPAMAAAAGSRALAAGGPAAAVTT
jgi:UDP-N-acetylglucosamine 1-carboxyvinyltransferase